MRGVVSCLVIKKECIGLFMDNSNTIFNIINIFAILLSPVIAVCITLWYQNYKAKQKEKINLFLTLMANRKTFPRPYSVVNNLNTIDLVFQKHTSVLILWHQYYDSLHQKAENVDWEKQNHLYLDMLTEMARILGYKNLKQTEIDKFYTPISFDKQIEISQELQHELLRVLKGTSRFLVFPNECQDKTSELKDQNLVQKKL